MSVLSQVAMIVLSWLAPFGVLILAGPIIGGGPLEVPLLVAALVIAVALSVRGTECGVDCTRETITVRGWVRTVSIPADAVVRVDQDRYALLWRDGDDERATRLHAFARSRKGIDRHSRESLERLADWVGSR
jgi:Bacterial PH domain